MRSAAKRKGCCQAPGAKRTTKIVRAIPTVMSATPKRHTEREKLTASLALYGEDWEEVLRHAKSKRPLGELKAYYAAHLVEEVARAKAQLDLCLGDESHGMGFGSRPRCEIIAASASETTTTAPATRAAPVATDLHLSPLWQRPLQASAATLKAAAAENNRPRCPLATLQHPLMPATSLSAVTMAACNAASAMRASGTGALGKPTLLDARGAEAVPL